MIHQAAVSVLSWCMRRTSDTPLDKDWEISPGTKSRQTRDLLVDGKKLVIRRGSPHKQQGTYWRDIAVLYLSCFSWSARSPQSSLPMVNITVFLPTDFHFRQVGTIIILSFKNMQVIAFNKFTRTRMVKTSLQDCARLLQWLVNLRVVIIFV